MTGVTRAGGIPTLQEVCDEGNETTTGFTLKSGAGITIKSPNNAFSIVHSLNNSGEHYFSSSDIGIIKTRFKNATDQYIELITNNGSMTVQHNKGTYPLVIGNGIQVSGMSIINGIANGLIRYNTTLNKFRVYENGGWRDM